MKRKSVVTKRQLTPKGKTQKSQNTKVGWIRRGYKGDTRYTRECTRNYKGDTTHSDVFHSL